MNPSNTTPNRPGPRLGPDGPADHVVHLRVTGAQKGRWVAAARRRGQSLSAWCAEHLDREADRARRPPTDR